MYPNRRSKIEPLETLSDAKNHEQWQDKTPLRRSEKIAWYIQNATICGFGWVAFPIYMPMIVMDISNKVGVQASNHTLPCDTTIPQPACEAKVFGHYLDPGSISLYLSSFCSVFSLVCSLSLSAVADHDAYRKKFMVIFSIIGGLCTIAYLLLEIPKVFWVIGILAPVSWASYNIVNVISHAYLTIYGRVHPRVLDAEAEGATHVQILKAEEQSLNDLSAYSGTVANMGSLLIQGVCIAISHFMHDSSLSLELAVAFTGVWWLGWQLAVAPWLRARPGPPLEKGQNWVLYSWKTTFKTLRSMRKIPQLFKFTLGWFMLSDGVGTLQSTVFLITYRELGFSHTYSMIFTMVLTILAAISMYLSILIRKRWHLSTKTLIMGTLGMYMILILYLAVTPLFTTRFGLRHKYEAWIVILIIGLIISTFYSTMRVMLAELSPPGDESEWFAMYLLADKGSSWIGPFVTAWIYQVAHQYRIAFWFPAGLIALGMLIIWSIDIPKGKIEARTYAAEKQKKLDIDFDMLSP
ncbi:Autophagy protein 22 [Actinomortierella wolfii]|nr:Autophagy protein 22 [Actinomortierella wolfii]